MVSQINPLFPAVSARHDFVRLTYNQPFLLMFLFQFALALLLANHPRQVLLFSTSNEKSLLEKQIVELQKDKPGIKEREIQIKIIETTVDDLAMWKTCKVDLSTPFTFILVGKDGGEKFRSNSLVTLPSLFSLIDAMPMRRNELKKKQ